MSGPWIQTYTNLKFEYLNPTPDMISIEDIAAGLSKQVRYHGHTKFPYSIAQHSFLVSRACSPENALSGLLHDAMEAYVGDIATPLKRLIPDYREIEHRIWKVIAQKFGIPEDLPDEVKEMDARILQNERKVLLGRSPEPWHPSVEELLPIPGISIDIWSWDWAETKFLRRFNDIVS